MKAELRLVEADETVIELAELSRLRAALAQAEAERDEAVETRTQLLEKLTKTIDERNALDIFFVKRGNTYRRRALALLQRVRHNRERINMAFTAGMGAGQATAEIDAVGGLEAIWRRFDESSKQMVLDAEARAQAAEEREKRLRELLAEALPHVQSPQLGGFVAARENLATRIAVVLAAPSAGAGGE